MIPVLRSIPGTYRTADYVRGHGVTAARVGLSSTATDFALTSPPSADQGTLEPISTVLAFRAMSVKADCLVRVR